MNRNIKSFLRLIDELRFMAGGYQRYFAFMVILFLANAAIEVVGLGMIGAYASLLISPTSHNDLTILPGWLRELFFGKSSHDQIILVGQALVFLFFLKAMMLIGINALITLIVGKIGIHIKMRAVASYIQLPYLAYTRRPGSHYIVASDTYSVQAAGSIKSLLKLLSEGILAVGLLSLLVTANALAVFLLTGLIGLALLAYDRSFRRRMFHYGKRINENRKIAVQALQEGLLGLKEIRILGREEFFTNRVKSSMDKVVHSQVKDKVIRVLPEAGLQFLLIVAVVATVSLAFETQEEILETLPIIGLFALAGLRLVPVGVNTGVAVSQLRSARHAVNELYLDLTKSGYGNQHSPGAVGGHGLNQDCEALVKEFKSLKIVNLTFSYPGSGKPILEDINFQVSKGESVGLMGASGVGKSTLLDVVLGLIPPDRGIIEVNGVDIRKVKKCWQELVAYIPQEVFLVNGTVKENVALGEHAEAVDEKKVLSALEKAKLLTVLDDRLGVQTLVGERGLRLSGGQRQRIAIARALYFEREVIVMDEATSALDRATEKAISESLRDVMSDHTFIIVAHRQSTLEQCVRVYEIWDKRLMKVDRLRTQMPS